MADEHASSRLPREGPSAQSRQAAASVVLPALLYGVRIWASVSLALLIAFWVPMDDAYWAATSAAVVAQPAVGASLRKGRYRAVGTLIGGVFIVLLTALFPQDHFWFLTGLILWCGVCGFFGTILPSFAGYAAALSGYTAAIIFANVIDDPSSVFLASVNRVAEISLGIVSAGLVHALTELGDARVRLRGAFASIGSDIAKGLSRALKSGEETDESRKARRDLVHRMTALAPLIDAAIGEPSGERIRLARVKDVFDGFFTALSAWRAIANRPAASVSPAGHIAREALWPGFETISQGDWGKDPAGVREVCGIERQRALQVPASDLSSRLLVDRSEVGFRALEQAANGVAMMSRPGSLRRHLDTSTLLTVDALPAAINGLRVIVTMSVSALFWIWSQWPAGQLFVTFGAIGVILFSPLAEAGYTSAVDFAVGSALAVAIAAVLGLAVLPAVNGGFVSLSLVLACVLIPLGALSAGTWHRLAFFAMVISILPILAIENVPSYDASQLFNGGVAIVAGIIVAALFLRLIPPLAPLKRVKRLLHRTRRDLMHLLTGRTRMDNASWAAVVARRLADMPRTATPDQEARLLAYFSVGEAAISLLELRPRLPDGWDALEPAFARLVDGEVEAARDSFARFSASQPDDATATPASINAAVIADALTRHPEFFRGDIT